MGENNVADMIFPFPDREACIGILEQDPCYGKILPEDRDAVFEEAWNVGLMEAEKFLKEHEAAGLDMERILRDNGYKIQKIDKDYVIGNKRFFCELYPAKNTVAIYVRSVKLWANSHELPYEYAKNIILAHEYFHHLESKQIGWTSGHYLVPMLRIGNFKLGKTGIAALSEVAANAFANGFYTRCEELGLYSEIESLR